MTGLPMNADVIIIGGGPAGLAAAFWHRRKHPDQQVLVLEARSRAGGWVQSNRRDGYLCEVGPQGIRPTDSFAQLVAELGVQDQLVEARPSASRRWFGRDGKLLPVPSGPISLLTSPLLSWRGKLRLLRESRVSPAPGVDGEESMASFCLRRFGPETVPLVHAMVGGVFAGDAERLEVASAFPMVAQLEREHGSVMRGMRKRRQARRANPNAKKRPTLVTFGGGMADLTQCLAAQVGDALRCDAPVQAVQRNEHGWLASMCDGTELRARRLVMACPAHVSARLLAGAVPELSTELRAIPFASLASVYLGLAMTAPPKKLTGFGFLLASQLGNPVLGAIYVSQIFPSHAPEGHVLVRVMIGGVRHPDIVAHDDVQLITTAVETLAKYTGITIDPSFTHVERCRTAIPQYELGHDQRMRRIATMLAALPGLRLCGNSYKGVAVTAQLGADALISAAHTATREQVALS